MADDLRSFLEGMLALPPFHHWLGPVLEEADEAARSLVVRIPSNPQFARMPDGPGFHGGIVAATIDVAAHAAISILTRRATPTVDLRVDYLRASSGTDILARARIVRAGRRLGTVQVELQEPDERLIAIGTATFYLQSD